MPSPKKKNKGIMTRIRENCQTIIAIAILFGMASGAVAYFAKASELKLIAMRLDQKILNDRKWNMQEEIFQLKREYGQKPEDRKIQEKIERLEIQIKDIEREIKEKK